MWLRSSAVIFHDLGWVELFQSCAIIKIIMNGRLFITLLAAIVCGVVASYAIITWLRQREQKLMLQSIQPKGEIGFAAVMKQRGEIPAA